MRGATPNLSFVHTKLLNQSIYSTKQKRPLNTISI